MASSDRSESRHAQGSSGMLTAVQMHSRSFRDCLQCTTLPVFIAALSWCRIMTRTRVMAVMINSGSDVIARDSSYLGEHFFCKRISQCFCNPSMMICRTMYGCMRVSPVPCIPYPTFRRRAHRPSSRGPHHARGSPCPDSWHVPCQITVPSRSTLHLHRIHW